MSRLLLLALFCGFAVSQCSANDPTRPNIVIVLVDDMGVMDTSVPFLTDDQGQPLRYPLNEFYHTPAMERLASQGVRFNNFCAMSVCSPTRVSIMTGQNAARHRTTNWINPDSNNVGPRGPANWNWSGLTRRAITLPGLLRKAGYRTIHIGKGHFAPRDSEGSDPLNLGFDINIGGAAFGAPGSYFGEENFGLDGRNDKAAVPHLEKYHGTQTHLTEALTLEAKEVLSQMVYDKEGPFFLYFSHYAVHAPFQSDSRFAARYAESGYPESAQAFATLVEGMDKSLGDLLDHLEFLGVAEETLIFFLGDNGSDAPLGHQHEVACAAPLRGRKGSHYEGGMRVPLIASWAKPDPNNYHQRQLPIAADAIQPQQAAVQDLFPTLLAVAGVEVPEGHVVDGLDLGRLLTGRADTGRHQRFLMHYPHGPHRSDYFTVMRDGPWKVIYHYFPSPASEGGHFQLYHLEKDPFEQNNLAASCPDELNRMMRQVISELQQQGALFPVSGEEKNSVLPKTLPNVVVFLADDAGWGDFGATGNLMAETPRIDSLARDGVSLDRFFVCPVCSPTRAEFLTGRYHPRGGVRGVSMGQERLDLEEQTIADVFRAAGYATGAFGKWHNGSQYPYHPVGRGFDDYFGHTAGHWGEYFDARLEQHDGNFIRTKGYIVDVCTDRALQFIRSHHQQPFFCYIPFTTPHSPWAVPDEDWHRFREREILQPATLPDQENPDHTRCAHAMLRNQDRNVGRVLDLLEELGLSSNTIVVYFSDNGPNSWRFNGGMKGRKGSTDEGGLRSVCFLRWPNHLPAGRTVLPISGAIDLLPTLASLAGVRALNRLELDGLDLSPLLRGEIDNWPDRMIFSTWNNQVSVRTPTHRLDHQGNLFDMLVDPNQTRAINDQDPIMADRLEAAIQDWKRDVFPENGSSMAILGVDPRPLPVGYPEFPVTHLPARDGVPRGGVKRSSTAPNSSYFVNWNDTQGTMTWSVNIQTPGRYLATIDYTCPLSDAGAIVELSFGDRTIRGTVEPGWDPPLYDNQDTLPRPTGESPMKEFRSLELGEIELVPGRSDMLLRAIDVPGDSVMDVRRITLTLLNEG
jgi:arylsulfatase A-like enzyme